ncbi:MAG TPA: YihY/virulence factor BrkB family protein, partial [Phototrophicaceae bacterium]|nr:YihY/virulence factor BrkB family protein [Phototrophicaceae bacterium]
MKYIKDGFDLLRTTFTEWNQDGAPRLAASLAYYTVFSIAPLLIIIIAIIGFVISEDAVRSNIIHQVQLAVGSDAAQFVRDLIDNMSQPSQGIISTLLGVVALLLGAIGVFDNLQVALDIIWNVDQSKRKTGVLTVVKDKLLSFGMLLVVGMLLLISLVISTILSALNTYVISQLPGGDFLLQLVSFAISAGVITLLFAMIYKVLPHIRLEWRDVWVGAAVTAILFSIGKMLLAFYLARSSTASPYGAAGAFVLILLWVYYSAQIILFGAEFTQVYARRHGSKTYL